MGTDIDVQIQALKAADNLPRHIAVIMDGNGRWAKKRRLPRLAGHGRESVEAIDHELTSALHLFLLNRGFLLTPFHNMMLASPATATSQVDAFLAALDGALGEFSPWMQAA
jgi:glutamate-1-semialdehyde 2,1-aminomutase